MDNKEKLISPQSKCTWLSHLIELGNTLNLYIFLKELKLTLKIYPNEILRKGKVKLIIKLQKN